MVPVSTATLEKDVIEDLQRELRMMRDGFDIEGDLTANDLINIDLEVSVSDALSYVDIIEGIKGQENECDDDD